MKLTDIDMQNLRSDAPAAETAPVVKQKKPAPTPQHEGEFGGALVKEVLEALGITQARLAEMVGVNPSIISAWMRDVKYLPPHRRTTLENLLMASRDYDNWRTEAPDDSSRDRAIYSAYIAYLDTGFLPDGRDAGHVNEEQLDDLDLDFLLRYASDEELLEEVKLWAKQRRAIVDRMIENSI